LIEGYDSSVFIMCKTKRDSSPSVNASLLKVFPSCPRGSVFANVNIKIFDEHGLVEEMATSQEVVTKLKTFLNGMKNSVGLQANVVARLSAINFQVAYANSGPGKSEIDRFRANDFPIYLMTASGSFISSRDDIVALLVKHKIPELSFFATRRPGSDGVPNLDQIHPYKDIENDWDNRKTVLGFGIPGPYFLPGSQSKCRKVGIIKMQDGMIENVQFPQRKAKLLSVIKHELGHMMGIDHQDNNLMDRRYEINAQFSNYTNDQIWVASREPLMSCNTETTQSLANQ
jgi:hypothetical protein